MKTAYPSVENGATLTLYSNIPFDNTYKNHSFISNQFYITEVEDESYVDERQYENAKQEYFIDAKKSNGTYVYTRWTLTDVFNFDFKNGLIASVTLELTNEQTLANYLKVSVGSQSWFYFITSIVQTNFNTYTLSLELDVIMTYGDDFLEGMRNVPVFTKRKHCRRYLNNYVFSYDYKNGDSTFANVKPNLVKGTYDSKINYHVSSEEGNNILNNIMWLYVVCDIVGTYENYDTYCFKLKDIKNPFSIIAFPLNCNINIIKGENTYTFGISPSTTNGITRLIEEGHYKGSKILPYAPFDDLDNASVGVDTLTGNIQITIDSNSDVAFVYNTGSGVGYMQNTGYNISFGNELTEQGEEKNLLLKNAFVITRQNFDEYYYNPINYQDFSKYVNMAITNPRHEDAKLLFKPFRKYCLTSASGDELEFYPELLTSLSPFTNANSSKLHLKTRTSFYGGDYTTFTYISPVALTGMIGFYNYRQAKIGLSTTMNYTIPVGTNALDVFKATQSQTYYQSKMASGITSGLTIAGGVASIIGGAVITAGSSGSASPVGVGLIASGVGAIAGGTASLANVVKSTNAKIEDLKNTPNDINVSGSSYAHDIVMMLNDLRPYVNVYECSPVTKESADDMFYMYGYEISRECYFNYIIDEPVALKTKEDNKLFTRTIFNYIELQDDITTKINADIPYVVKQKLSSIFNNGITLWTFFGFYNIYTNVNMSSTYDFSRWLYKNDKENKEYEGETYIQ